MRGCSGNNGDAQNAEDRSFCAHQRQEVILLQSCLSSENHGDHQETHWKEELTKGVVLKHIVTVTTREARVQNFFLFCKSDDPGQKKKDCL